MSYRRQQVLGALGRQASALLSMAAELNERYPAAASALRSAAETVLDAQFTLQKETTP